MRILAMLADPAAPRPRAKRSGSVRQWSMIALIIPALLMLAAPRAEAGLLLSTTTLPNSGDATELQAVKDAITSYNATHATSYSSNITLSLKLQDSTSFTVAQGQGFQFYSDPGGTQSVATGNGLLNLSTAYFSSMNPGLLYYLVKAGRQTAIYAYQPGSLNVLSVNNNKAISHVTFFDGPASPAVTPTPEPSSLISGSVGGAFGLACWLKRRRRATA